MVEPKMITTLLLLLLTGHFTHAVVNKAQASQESEKNEIKADDRISNFGSGFNGPAPVYGPPELIGEHGPTPIYPPPPPDVPPPVLGLPVLSFGPPRDSKPFFGPVKTNFGSKPIYGPPKYHFSSIKQQFGPPPPSFGSFRPPKPAYGVPVKFSTPQVSLGALSVSVSPVKSNNIGVGILPVTLDAFGPPTKKAVPFVTPKDDYGPPPPLPPPPAGLAIGQLQIGVSHGNSFGPPPRPPPPGVPAPPTPPDIKYDGWQPIAGLSRSPNGNYPNSQGSSHSHSTNSNVPSDSYGIPIHSPEAQDLKSSVHGTATADNNGLPPPPLPQYEPFHTEHEHSNSGGGITDNKQLNLQYGPPNVEPLSIVKTVGFELLPTTGALNSDLQGLSLSDGGSLDLSNSFDSGSLLSSIRLNQGINGGSGDLSNGYHSVGDDLSLQHLPQTPAEGYGAPGNNNGGSNGGSITALVPAISLPPPPPVDSYGAPPLNSYSPNGPYPAAQTGRGIPSLPFSTFGLLTTSFQKPPPRPSFRPPSPTGSLIPPRNREPIKFRESIPTGLLSAINRYLPPLRQVNLKSQSKPVSHVPTLVLGQQLPSLNAPISFHQSNSFSKGVSGSFSTAFAAPNVQYGTPLSFTDFNTPAPVLTYGAPNFGPATAFPSTTVGLGNNLYEGIGNTLTTTYGTPVVSATSATSDCGFQQSNAVNAVNAEFGEQGNQAPAPVISLSLDRDDEPTQSGFSQEENQKLFNLAAAAISKTLDTNSKNLNSPYDAPSVNELDLQNYEQQKTGLRDSYGNPIGISYETSEQSPTEPTNLPRINLQQLPPETFVQASAVTPSEQSPPAVTISVASSGPNQGAFATATSQQNGNGISLGLKGFGPVKSYGKSLSLGNEVDGTQFLKTDEGGNALAVAQGLTADGTDGFQIQGSKGTYMLQIQPAEGSLGTEDSDGGIRHEQVLSNGLLQDILAAIEQPEQGLQLQGLQGLQLQGVPQGLQLQVPSQAPALELFGQNPHGEFLNGEKPVEEEYDDLQPPRNDQEEEYDDLSEAATGQTKGRYVAIEESSRKSEKEAKNFKKSEPIALFFNNQYGEGRKDTRAVRKSESISDSKKSS